MDHVEAQVMGANLVDLTGYVYVPDTPEEKALVRKIDLHILPMLWVMYIMNYVSIPQPVRRRGGVVCVRGCRRRWGKTGAMLGSGDRSGMMAFCGYIGVKLYCGALARALRSAARCASDLPATTPRCPPIARVLLLLRSQVASPPTQATRRPAPLWFLITPPFTVLSPFLLTQSLLARCARR